MITNNMRKWVKLQLAGGTGNAGTMHSDDKIGFVGDDGHASTVDDTALGASNCYVDFTQSKSLLNITYSTLRSSSTSSQCNIPYACIGHSVSEEPDYTLGNLFTDNLTISTANTKLKDLLYTTVIVNAGSSDIVFDEVGLFVHIYTSGSSYSWNGVTSPKVEFMLIKEKLDAEMTLPAGGSVSITFNVSGDVSVEVA